MQWHSYYHNETGLPVHISTLPPTALYLIIEHPNTRFYAQYNEVGQPINPLGPAPTLEDAKRLCALHLISPKPATQEDHPCSSSQS